MDGKIAVGIWNINTLTGKEFEIMEEVDSNYQKTI